MKNPPTPNSKPQVQVFEQKKRWKLSAPWWPVWNKDDVWYCMPIPRSYAYDGASIPKLLWWLVAPFELGIVPPGKHDWLHENKGLVEIWKWDGVDGVWRSLGEVQWSRHDADRMFFRDMKENAKPIPRWARRGAFKAVRLWSQIYDDKWE